MLASGDVTRPAAGGLGDIPGDILGDAPGAGWPANGERAPGDVAALGAGDAVRGVDARDSGLACTCASGDDPGPNPAGVLRPCDGGAGGGGGGGRLFILVSSPAK
ncbi:hypothetical protein H4S01_004547 [Coemansia sp. RSA 2610]|nr:hypothetical protein H4S01_004547 [Coemansia sp. RSA 2610]